MGTLQRHHPSDTAATMINTAIPILSVVVAITSALPQQNPPVAILRDERLQPIDGAYSFQVETENGITQSEQGSAGSAGQTNTQGSFSFPMEDGTLAEVTYIADENGFQPQSPLLPVAPAFPHPIPQFVLDQIAFAQEQRAKGIEPLGRRK